MFADPASHRTGNLRGDIGENIAVKVRHYDHIKYFRSIGELCGSDVNDPVLILDIGIFLGDLFVDLMKEPIRTSS